MLNRMFQPNAEVGISTSWFSTTKCVTVHHKRDNHTYTFKWENGKWIEQ